MTSINQNWYFKIKNKKQKKETFAYVWPNLYGLPL